MPQMAGHEDSTCSWQASKLICAVGRQTLGAEVDHIIGATNSDPVTVPEKDQRMATLDSEKIAGSLLAQLDTRRPSHRNLAKPSHPASKLPPDRRFLVQKQWWKETYIEVYSEEC